jgi:hypothetical protein
MSTGIPWNGPAIEALSYNPLQEEVDRLREQYKMLLTENREWMAENLSACQEIGALKQALEAVVAAYEYPSPIPQVSYLYFLGKAIEQAKKTLETTD